MARLEFRSESIKQSDWPTFDKVSDIDFIEWSNRNKVKTLLSLAADEIDRLRAQINNKNAYEKWLDEKHDRERD